MRFNKGDEVKVVRSGKGCILWGCEKEELVGNDKPYVVERIDDNEPAVRLERGWFPSHCLELVEEEPETAEEVAVEEVPKPAFKVGDKVRVVRAEPEHDVWVDELDSYVGNGIQYSVEDVDEYDSTVRLERGWFPEGCLELVTEEAVEEAPKPEFKVGDKVRVTHKVLEWDGDRWVSCMDETIGREGTINRVNRDGDFHLTPFGKNYPAECLELVAEEVVEEVPKPEFKVGDKVRVVRADRGWRGWVPTLEKYVGNGKVYEIAEQGRDPNNFYIDSWYFPSECLDLVSDDELVTATEASPEPTPAPRKTLDDCSPEEWDAASRIARGLQDRSSWPIAPPKSSTPSSTPMSAYAIQEGGKHYKKLAIQPTEYAMANEMDACQFSIVKYVTRHEDKAGIEDLRKARHTLEILAQEKYGEAL
ncbi:DUF3310 domain-containing protein [Microbulbifer sp. ZKSA002]|uniref:DUF3310 domain-containing protein n=1 Tax=Microbulbifer sp. ZKSA002 TaxID=3243388 RepID=UPI0040398CCB